jgi:hypothetical protein
VGNGADDSQHGQAWREVRTLALRATTPRKGVFAFGNPTHLITLHCIIMYNTVYIYPLQVKINHVKALQNLLLFSVL